MTRLAPLLLVPLLLAACSAPDDAGDAGEAATTTSVPTTSAPASSAASSSAASGSSPTGPTLPLADAQYAFRTGGWWSWRLEVTRGDGQVLRAEDGRVDAADAQEPQAFLSGGGVSDLPRQLSAVYLGPDAWFHRGELTADDVGCWVHRAYPPRDVVGSGSVFLLPPAVRVLLTGQPRRQRPGVLVGDADLDSVAESMGSLVPFGLRLPGGQGTAPVRYALADDGTISGWSAELDDLVTAARALGAEPDPTIVGLHARIEVTFRRTEPQQLAPPPTSQVVEWDEANEPLQVAFGRCGRV
jgi:hypothetical protein